MCSDLIGRKYSYGKDDCIHLVIDALERMGIKNPGVKEDWYEMTPKEVLAELNRYCDRLDCPSYDGDVVLLTAKPPSFGVVWQRGILFVNFFTQAVDWKPMQSLIIRRSYRMKER